MAVANHVVLDLLHGINGLLPTPRQVGSEEVVRLLLERGASLFLNGAKQQTTALHIACERGQEDMVAVLLSHGAAILPCASVCKAIGVIDHPDSSGQTALHVASFNGFVPVIQLLLQHDASVHSVDKRGSTPVHLASQEGHERAVDVLLKATQQQPLLPSTMPEQGLDKLNLDDWACPCARKRHDCNTPLLLASRNGHTRVVIQLLSHLKIHHLQSMDTVLHFRDENEWTALHIATLKGHAAIVQLLLANGARSFEATSQGTTAFDIAMSCENDEIAELFGRALVTQFLQSDIGKAEGLSSIVLGKMERGTPTQFNAIQSVRLEGNTYMALVPNLEANGTRPSKPTYPASAELQTLKKAVVTDPDQPKHEKDSKTDEPAPKKGATHDTLPHPLSTKQSSMIKAREDFEDLPALLKNVPSFCLLTPRVWFCEPGPQLSTKLYIPTEVGRSLSLHCFKTFPKSAPTEVGRSLSLHCVKTFAKSTRWIPSSPRRECCLLAVSSTESTDNKSVDIYRIWWQPHTGESFTSMVQQVPSGIYVGDGGDGWWGLCGSNSVSGRNDAQTQDITSLVSHDDGDELGPRYYSLVHVDFGSSKNVHQRVPTNAQLFPCESGAVWLFVRLDQYSSTEMNRLDPELSYFDDNQDPTWVMPWGDSGQDFFIASDACRRGVFVLRASSPAKAGTPTDLTLMHFQARSLAQPRQQNHPDAVWVEVRSIHDNGTDDGVYVHCKDRKEQWKLGYVSLQKATGLVPIMDFPKANKLLVDSWGVLWFLKKKGKTRKRTLLYRPHPGNSVEYPVGLLSPETTMHS